MMGTMLGPCRDYIGDHETQEATAQVPRKYRASTPEAMGQATGQVTGQVDMTPRGYTEDALVEQPAIALLAEMGWEAVNAYHDLFRGHHIPGTPYGWRGKGRLKILGLGRDARWQRIEP